MESTYGREALMDISSEIIKQSLLFNSPLIFISAMPYGDLVGTFYWSSHKYDDPFCRSPLGAVVERHSPKCHIEMKVTWGTDVESVTQPLPRTREKSDAMQVLTASADDSSPRREESRQPFLEGGRRLFDFLLTCDY